MTFDPTTSTPASSRPGLGRLPDAHGRAGFVDTSIDEAPDRTIGHLLGVACQLDASQIDHIAAHQQAHGIRFGEAAVALGLATRDDVLRALSQQFSYPYVPAEAVDGRLGELVVAGRPFGERAEAFRELRSQLMMGVLGPGEDRRALAVVSPDVGDGKTYVAANLAVAFSQLGGHTLVIDLDMRTPRQHQVLDVDNTTGLSNILSGRSEANVIRAVRDLPNLFVLPVGNTPPNPLELVQRPALGMLIRELLTKFDFIVVDTPASRRGADARVIAACCGATLAVGRTGRSRMKSMQALIDGLARGPSTLAGIVMNEH